MKYVLPQLASMVLCAATAGCVSSPSPPPPAPLAVAQPTGAISYDGTYSGYMQLSRGAADSCGTQDALTLRVANQGFHYVLNQPQVDWQPTRGFDVSIAADGAFLAQSGSALVSGRVSGGHMQGEIIGDACGFQFQADKSGT